MCVVVTMDTDVTDRRSGLGCADSRATEINQSKYTPNTIQMACNDEGESTVHNSQVDNRRQI